MQFHSISLTVEKTHSSVVNFDKNYNLFYAGNNITCDRRTALAVFWLPYIDIRRFIISYLFIGDKCDRTSLLKIYSEIFFILSIALKSDETTFHGS